MIGKTISHYKILQKIGGGGMGAVYKAEDLTLRRTVALKFIHPELITDEQHKRRFLREAQAASAIEHPNIYNIFEVDETPEGRPFICMAYYGENSLAKKMDGSPFPARELFQIGFSVAQGLACAHRNEIIHRDIKPSNIVITEEGFIKIVDFGLAKLADTTAITHSGTAVGTVRYMSPEQAQGEFVDRRTDIWALGVVLFEMATGKSPFRGQLNQAVVYSILHDEIPSVTELNAEIPKSGAHIIAKCLDRDIDKRYQTVEEILADMAVLADEMGWGSSIAGLSIPALESRKQRARRHRIRTSVVATVVLAAALFTVWWNSREPSIFVTDVRLAVMPLDNKSHPGRGPLVAGLSQVVYEMLDEVSRRYDSMWVVRDALVRYARLPEADGAHAAFGVNRIITGNVQQHANGQLLMLELLDAATMESIRSVTVPFEADSPKALADSLPGAVLALFDIDTNASVLNELIPNDSDLFKFYVEGIGYLQQEQYDAAIASLERARSGNPEFAPGQNMLGWSNWRAYLNSEGGEYYDRAITHLETATRLNPDYWRADINLGEIYRMTGEDDKAIVVYQSALKTDPANVSACRGLSRVYKDQNRFDEAERLLRSAIERRPDYFEAQCELGLYFYRMGEEEKSIRALNKTLALAPNDAYSHNILGAIYHGQGRYTLAREQFERAFRLLPDYNTCGNVGLMLYFEKRFKESADYYQYALEYTTEDNAQAWGNLASSLYWVEGERDRSIELFKRAIQLLNARLDESPEDASIIVDLIEYYAMSGDENNTLKMIAVADTIADNNPELLYAIGDAYEILEKRTIAMRYLSDAVKYGFPVARIQGTHELTELVQDPMFQRLITADSVSEPAGKTD